MASHDDPSSTSHPLEFPETRPSEGLIGKVKACLNEAGIVAIPTETVYGLLARADSEEGLDRLRSLKGRDPNTAFTWHVSEAAAIDEFKALTPLARRLAGRYWPGPLSLVLKGVPAGLELVAGQGWTGLRQPAHRGLTDLIAHLDFPVVATSANLSGQSPATSAAEVTKIFGTGVPLVLDGGTSRLREPSAVLRVGPGQFQLLREGLLPIEDLRRTAGLRIGFVCTGNTCRSPMAEGLAKRALETRLGLLEDPSPKNCSAIRIEDFGFEVSSMGVYAAPGAPPSRLAVEVLAAEGVDIAAHLSRPAIPEEVLALDEVYGLTRSHLEALRLSLPPGKQDLLHLLDPGGDDISDPFGGSKRDYARARDAIRAAIEERSKDWA